MWSGFGGDDLTSIIDPRWYLPLTTEQSNFAGQWAAWYHSAGEEGERPPDEVVRQYELYRDVLATPDDDERDDLMREIIRIAKDKFYTIGTVLTPENYGILANEIRNVPLRQPDSWPFPNPGLSYPEQYFIDPNADAT